MLLLFIKKDNMNIILVSSLKHYLLGKHDSREVGIFINLHKSVILLFDF